MKYEIDFKGDMCINTKLEFSLSSLNSMINQNSGLSEMEGIDGKEKGRLFWP
jgi:hypothetical protein